MLVVAVALGNQLPVVASGQNRTQAFYKLQNFGAVVIRKR